jgi:hypothetical protein
MTDIPGRLADLEAAIKDQRRRDAQAAEIARLEDDLPLIMQSGPAGREARREMEARSVELDIWDDLMQDVDGPADYAEAVEAYQNAIAPTP